jgi:ribonuclease HI
LRPCGGCGVVSYCGPEHQAAHRAKHKQICNAVKKTREALEREETRLKSNPSRVIENVFKKGAVVSEFRSLPSAPDYMRTRLRAADALLKACTTPAVEQALDHFTDMIRLDRMDDLRVRDFIPGLLLRLGREQECYNFLKWWATVNDSADTTRPYLNIRNADAFEPVDMFCSRTANLSHLVMLTLLKLRLSLDLQAYESRFEFDFGDPIESDPPLGKLVQSRVQHMSPQRIAQASTALTAQYHRLCRAVNDRNPHFWGALVDGGKEVSIMPQSYNRGSLEEAQVALHRCKAAWQESEDALVMLEADTCSFVSVYRGPTTDADGDETQSAAPAQAVANMEIRRGVGSVFPTQFPQTSSLELFATTRVGHAGVVWFVSTSQPRQVLVYVDGACLNNGQAEPRAGWAVVHGPGDVTLGRLENKGPFGDDSVATSNRAELRAAIAALRLCDWQTEGLNSLVIATDSTYVVDGATGWARGWVRNGWKTRTGDHVKNKDMWELLLGETERWWVRGFRVALWKIPRERNAEADGWAKEAAVARSDEPRFRDVMIEATRQTAPQTTTLAVNSRLGSNPRILALCLEYEGLFDECFGSLVSQLNTKAQMERATTAMTALQMLNRSPPPSIILVADGAITRQKEVFERVIDRLHEGATVVLAGCFRSMVTMGQFDRFFARIGLPWRKRGYHRATVSLRQQPGNSDLANHLPSEYSQKAVFVKNVDKSAVWYSEGGGSDMAAVAFTKFGLGRLGYIGDVNGEEGSDAAVLAMCGLLG